MTLSDLIKYNREHKDVAMPPRKSISARIVSACSDCSIAFESQEQLESAESDDTTEAQKSEAFQHAREVARSMGIDRAMTTHGVDLLIGPGDSDLYTYAAYAGRSNET